MTRIILGIDPGSRITGYGFLAIEEGVLRYLDSGCIKTEGGEIHERLAVIFNNICELVKQYQPTEAAIEEVFVQHNVQSALKLGQARGAAIAAMSTGKMPITGYTARQVKKAIVGYGQAEKGQVQEMVKTLLKLNKVPQADAADALAIALCHLHSAANLNFKR